MFIIIIILSKSHLLVDITLPISLFSLYVDDPELVILRTTIILLPNFSYSYESEPSLEICTSIVDEFSPRFISSAKKKNGQNLDGLPFDYSIINNEY